MSLLMSSTQSLAQKTVNLTPNYKYCVDRPAAEKIQNCLQENMKCHDALGKAAEGYDGSTVILTGVGALLIGFLIGTTVH
jgi:hypothetical protein